MDINEFPAVTASEEKQRQRDSAGRGEDTLGGVAGKITGRPQNALLRMGRQPCGARRKLEGVLGPQTETLGTVRPRRRPHRNARPCGKTARTDGPHEPAVVHVGKANRRANPQTITTSPFAPRKSDFSRIEKRHRTGESIAVVGRTPRPSHYNVSNDQANPPGAPGQMKQILPNPPPGSTGSG